MTPKKPPRSRMSVTELGDFLRDPPAGFTVREAPGSGYRVSSDPEKILVLIDGFHSCCWGRVVFSNSPGRKVKMHNLWEYTSMRKNLLSKRIYLLMSACQENNSSPSYNNTKAEDTVLQQFIVSIDGTDPLVRWQLERGLDWTISSVAGESYRVDIDLTEALQNWAEKQPHLQSTTLLKMEPVWRDASFTLKYCSDALFDFPYWFGFSKRKFQLTLT